MEVRCLEASGRIGGRIFTVHDPSSPAPIELGAEFIHGRPPEIWDVVRNAGLMVYEHTNEALHIDRGKVVSEKEVGEFAERVLQQMAKSARRRDESFEDYLSRSHQPHGVKDWARIHVEGFNAARKESISAAFLTKDAEAADQIEGDRVFRIVGGYDSLVTSLLRAIAEHHATIQLNTVVKKIQWRRGSVAVQHQSTLDREVGSLRCRQVIVTVPLGVLQTVPPAAGAISFDPEPREVLSLTFAVGHI